jgi:protein required for attachment to host cells
LSSSEKGDRVMSNLEAEIKDLLSGHRLSPEQRQGLQQGESDSDTVRSLQRMLANTQNALLRLAREIDELRAR